MTALPPGYEIRAGSMDDVSVVAALEAAYDTALLGAPYMDEAWVTEDWSRPRFDPAVDSWLVTKDDELAAYGIVCDEEGDGIVESLARVHPGHWGRGLGSALVATIEQRAREYPPNAPDGSVRLLNVVTAVDAGARALLERLGYAVDRHFWHMSLDLTSPLPTPPPRDGVVIRPFERAADTPAVHEVLESAFDGHYLYSPTPLDKWTEQQFDRDSFEEDLWLVATEGDRIVAALSGRRMLGEGWVSELGVLAPWRGRGIGAALLAEVFRLFEKKGFETAVLNVDAANTTGATALYERVGMRVRLQWELYAKTLAGWREPKASQEFKTDPGA